METSLETLETALITTRGMSKLEENIQANQQRILLNSSILCLFNCFLPVVSLYVPEPIKPRSTESIDLSPTQTKLKKHLTQQAEIFLAIRSMMVRLYKKMLKKQIQQDYSATNQGVGRTKGLAKIGRKTMILQMTFLKALMISSEIQKMGLGFKMKMKMILAEIMTSYHRSSRSRTRTSAKSLRLIVQTT